MAIYQLGSIIVAIALVLCSTRVSAQLEEVIVTAQKRAENQQDVPIAVTVLTANEMRVDNIDGQMQLPRVIPNLSFKQNSSFVAAFLRGVGTEFANAGLEPSVSVYLDDTYIPRAQSGLFSFTDTSRIEVLKGPQGTLYGRNATGGAIRIISNDPELEAFSGKLAATAGDEDRRIVEGVINIPVSDSVALRFSGKYNEANGYVDNIAPNPGLKEFSNFEESMVTGKLLYDVSDELRVKLSGDYSKVDGSNGFAFINLYEGAPQQIGAAFGGCTSQKHRKICSDLGNGGEDRPKPGGPIEAYGGALRIDYDFEGATFSSISAYRNVNEDVTADLDATGAYFQNATGTPETDQYTQEFQLISTSDGDLQYVLGFFYIDEEAAYDAFTLYGSGVELLGGLPPGFGTAGGGQVDVNSWAPYAQLDYNLAEDWLVTLGIRYTDEEKKLVYNELTVGPVNSNGHIPSSVSPAVEFEKDKVDFQEWTPRVTVTWHYTDDLMWYATYAEGFKSGGFNLPALEQPSKVEPEDLKSYELGWKYQGDTIRFNGAAFYYDYQNLQVQFVDQSSGGNRAQNAADAEITGLEADITWVPSEAWNFGAGLGYLDATYENFDGQVYAECVELPASTPGCAAWPLGLALLEDQDLSGNDLPQAPELSGYLRGSYYLDMNSAGSLTLSAIASYRDDAYFDAGNTFDDSSRTLLSARVTWNSTSEKFFVSLYGDNLTDEDYNVQKAPQNAGGWRIPAPPRQIFLQAGVNF